MSFGGKINPKSLKGGLNAITPNWMNNVGLYYGPNSIATANNPRYGLYVGNNITVTGSSNGNFIYWAGLLNGTTPSSLSIPTITNSVLINPSSGTVAATAGLTTMENSSTAIGSNSFASNSSVAIGANAYTTGTAANAGAVAMGSSASVTAQGGISIGSGVTNTGAGIAIGGKIASTLAATSSASGISIGLGSGSIANTASNNGVAIGYCMQANSTGCVQIGYNASSIAGGNQSISIGTSAATTGANSIAIGNTPTTSGRSAATAIGSNAQATFDGQITISNSGFAAIGDLTLSTIPMYLVTTNATPTELKTGDGTLTTTPAGVIILSNQSTYIFNCDIVARKSSTGTDYSAWNVVFCINRAANAASTALVGSVTKTVIGQTAGASAWDITVTADTTNGRPNISVTGQAATTIRWVANITMTKVSG